jgi:alkanesulfonate monooxygenase SsuD/methylene tetrahydromethanopterin reductase-like flavin-dependent oxidoreductase (luciferase family)
MRLQNFSQYLCNWGAEPQKPRDLIDVARHAEELGFYSVQIPHVPILPYSEERPPHGGIASFIGERYRHYQFDPLVLLPMIAQATSRIRIGFNVVVTPYLHPYVWAKYMASLDAATDGRLIAGFGLGFAPPQGEVIALRRLGMDSRKRGKMSDEALDMITRLWTSSDPVEQEGEFWKLRSVMVDPKPVQTPYPELWWAGDSEPAVERAARYAMFLEVMWPTAATIRERFVPALSAANAKWQRNTRISDMIFAEILPHGDISNEEAGKRYHTGYKKDGLAVGSPETVATTIRKLRDAGVDHFALDMHRHGWHHVRVLHEQMEAFVHKVLPLLQ